MTEPTAADLAQARALCRDAGWCDRCEAPEDYTAPCEHAARIAQALAAARAEGVAHERARCLAIVRYALNHAGRRPRRSADHRPHIRASACVLRAARGPTGHPGLPRRAPEA
jgi:hypothetical protein